MKGTSVYRRRRDKAEKPRTTTVLLRFFFVLLIAAAAYLIAGLLMDRLDLYSLVRSNPIEISRIDFSSADLPRWAVQALVGAAIFIILQPLLVILLDLARPRRDEGFDPDYEDQWRG
jgi:hypothetical protein